jgi:5-methylcytosine-specific restriction enzyme subunit McrC
LTDEQRTALLSHVPEVSVLPVWGVPRTYDITPGSFIGRLELPGLSVDIAPKVPMSTVMFMLAYALDANHWRPLHALFSRESGPLDAIAVAFSREIGSVLARGLLRGYAGRDDLLPTVRGRIRVAEQMRQVFRQTPRIACAYDEYTEDIAENRLLRAALRILRRQRLRSGQARASLARAEASLEQVTDVHMTRNSVPDITYTRLNERFRRALELARLIVEAGTFELGRGGVVSSSFLVDMSRIFERFVLTALGESRALRPWSLVERKARHTLDVGGRLTIIPDLACRNGGRIALVGDVKYKRTEASGARLPDVYQVLAYAVTFNVQDAVLIYPRTVSSRDSPGESSTLTVRHLGTRLHALGLDLASGPQHLLDHIDDLALRIRTRT